MTPKDVQKAWRRNNFDKVTAQIQPFKKSAAKSNNDDLQEVSVEKCDPELKELAETHRPSPQVRMAFHALLTLWEGWAPVQVYPPAYLHNSDKWPLAQVLLQSPDFKKTLGKFHSNPDVPLSNFEKVLEMLGDDLLQPNS
jgi:hypothetical protein